MLRYAESVRPEPFEFKGELDPEGPRDPQSDLAGDVTNFLVVGSDSRAVLSEAQQATIGGEEAVEGKRSDTVILVHLDDRRDTAVVVHFPRDLLVDIPGYGQDRINAAYDVGGPRLVVRTVKQLTELPIHHYVEINFLGFQKVVDLIGGVRICITRPMVDEVAGLRLTRKGCHTLRGHRALAFVRARHVEGDVIPDFARISRQQQFMRALLNKVLSVGTLLNRALVQEVARQVRTDKGLRLLDMYYLAETLKSLAQEKGTAAAGGVDFRVVPGLPQTIDGTSYVVASEADAAELFERLRTGRPLKRFGKAVAGTSPTPATVRVGIYHTGEAEVAGAVHRRLLQAGFTVLGVEPAPRVFKRRVILYPAGREAQAQLVADYYPDFELREVPKSKLGGADVILVVRERGGSSP
jgi:LCP family protein required for cell wall assembly